MYSCYTSDTERVRERESKGVREWRGKEMRGRVRVSELEMGTRMCQNSCLKVICISTGTSPFPISISVGVHVYKISREGE